MLEKCMEYFSQACPDILTFVPRFVLAIQCCGARSWASEQEDIACTANLHTAMAKCSNQTMTS